MFRHFLHPAPWKYFSTLPPTFSTIFLMLADGSYWNVNLDHPSARDIVMEPSLRGSRITVEADFYPELQTVQLIRVHEASSRLEGVGPTRPGSSVRANLETPRRTQRTGC